MSSMNKGAIRTEMEEGRKGDLGGLGLGGNQVPQGGLVIPAAPFGVRNGRHFYFRRNQELGTAMDALRKLKNDMS